MTPEPTRGNETSDPAGEPHPASDPEPIDRGPQIRRPHYIRFSAARLAIMAVLLVLAAVRLGLNPPLPRAVWVLLPGWFFVAAVYHLLQPRQEMPGWFIYLLRLSFFIYEVCVILLVTHFLGGSGWLAVLFLLLPSLELNLAFPGFAGSLPSLLAAFGAATIPYAEARGWLWYDPFFSVSGPLYREPAYVGAILVLAIVFLFVLPGWVSRYLGAETGTRS